MNILCDTCSVLMLIRIAPDMFMLDKFNCVAVHEVRKEILQTQRFKSKYPWRADYKDKIRPNSSISSNTDDFTLHFDTIDRLIETGIINKKTQRSFGLSYVDRRIATYSIAYDLEISSTDDDLADFLQQEFDKINKSPLAVLNEWIRKGLIKWNSDLQRIIEDWDKSGEPVQPNKDKIEFEKLSGFRYLGP